MSMKKRKAEANIRDEKLEFVNSKWQQSSLWATSFKHE